MAALTLVALPDQQIVGDTVFARKDNSAAGIFVVHRDYLLKSEMEPHDITNNAKKQDQPVEKVFSTGCLEFQTFFKSSEFIIY